MPSLYKSRRAFDNFFEADVYVTGDLTVDGAITGSITGSVTGNVTGNVTGLYFPTAQDADDDGAIDTSAGFVALSKETAGAYTLADPDAENDGQVLVLMDVSGQAHVVTYTNGFNGGANDEATFGGAAGDNIRLRAWGGVWYAEALLNVTLGTAE